MHWGQAPESVRASTVCLAAAVAAPPMSPLSDTTCGARETSTSSWPRPAKTSTNSSRWSFSGVNVPILPLTLLRVVVTLKSPVHAKATYDWDSSRNVFNFACEKDHWKKKEIWWYRIFLINNNTIGQVVVLPFCARIWFIFKNLSMRQCDHLISFEKTATAFRIQEAHPKLLYPTPCDI